MKWLRVAVPDDYDPATWDILWEHQPAGEIDYRTGNVPQTAVCQVWEPEYRQVLDYGFIGLQDFLGDDSTVVNAARVSYGRGTKRVTEDEGLLRYLMRHRHWTPFEMVEFLWHVKLPIFVERQWIRHRTANVNEYSARYSVMSDEMYMPEAAHMAPQARDNKQGRAGAIDAIDAKAIQVALDEVYDDAYQTYLYLLGEADKGGDSLELRRVALQEAAYTATREMTARALLPDARYPEWAAPTKEMIDAKIKEYFDHNGFAMVSPDYPGLARELARIALPVATYTQKYWKCDLRNTLNFLSLRCDPHAQYEIRVYAEAMLDMITPMVPWCMKAFMDYELNGAKLSSFEMKAIVDMLHRLKANLGDDTFTGDLESLMREQGASKREIREFLGRLDQ